ncbi:MAG: universal stress protein [Pseudomonadota bacterium]
MTDPDAASQSSQSLALVALVDGSLYSKSVCDHAAWAAKAAGNPVTVVHIMGRREAPEQRDLSGSIRLGARSALLNELSELDAQRSKLSMVHGRAILEDAQKLLEDAGVSEVRSLMRRGDLLEAIAELEADASMLVIGKRGEAADFARLHLGSNLERMVRSATKPVLVASRAYEPIKRAVVAFDGGSSSLKAIDMIARNPLFVGLAIHVVMVGGDENNNRTALNQAAALLKTGGHDAELHNLPGAPEAVLGGFVTQGDVLLMGAYGHSRIRSMIIGSTTSEMLRTCTVPVILVR